MVTRFTYEIAPTFTLMEEIVLQHMISKIGWEAGDGVFTPGGTLSNLYGVLLSRYAYDPRVKTDGVGLHKFVIFTSEHVCSSATMSWYVLAYPSSIMSCYGLVGLQSFSMTI